MSSSPRLSRGRAMHSSRRESACTAQTDSPSQQNPWKKYLRNNDFSRAQHGMGKDLSSPSLGRGGDGQTLGGTRAAWGNGEQLGPTQLL